MLRADGKLCSLLRNRTGAFGFGSWQQVALARFIFGSTKDPAPLRFFGIGSSSSSPFFLRFRVFFFFLSSSSSSSYSAPSSSIAFNHSFSVKLSV
ncbi:hypothetical protein ALC57_15197 [Trachymyrmex cornetzi]|uniref:Uncharacterized protein n=1 Tax=Trachymyrmex cornetzi TaxID=471704 RepID=A0A195DHU7_9HYME|nr:hypothetical protein ALC57_15197 [Trachymyrmex cornetzi]